MNSDRNANLKLKSEPLLFKETLTDFANEDSFQIERCLKDLGSFGLFQFLATILFSLTWGLNGILFIGLSIFAVFPQYTCSQGGEEFECSREDFCSDDTISWEIDWSQDESLHNIIVDFDMHCASKWQLGFLGTSFLLGYLLGTQILALVPVNYGKLKLFRRFFAVGTLGVLFLLLVKHLPLLYIGIGLYGISSIARQIVILYYVLELMESKFGPYIIFFFTLMYALVQIATIFSLQYLCNNWKAYISITLVLYLFTQLMSNLFHESPKQLYAQDKFDDLKEALTAIFKVNSVWNKNLREEDLKYHLDMIDRQQGTPKSSAIDPLTNVSVINSFKTNPTFRLNLILLCISAFSTYIICFGMVYFLKYIHGNLFQNYLFCTISELMSSFVYLAVHKRYGLKGCFFQAYGMALIGFVALLFLFDSEPYLISLCIFVIQLSVTEITFIYIQAGLDLFDPLINQQCSGYYYTVGRVGGMLGSQIAEIQYPFPLICFLSLCISQLIMTNFLRVKSKA